MTQILGTHNLHEILAMRDSISKSMQVSALLLDSLKRKEMNETRVLEHSLMTMSYEYKVEHRFDK